ncbi:MAG: hypothetical protein XXXJIFNMEKO3_LKCDNKCA_00094 (plasmid) [Candidatus Erwinia impunctatus]
MLKGVFMKYQYDNAGDFFLPYSNSSRPHSNISHAKYQG